jgi:hypothetical protein
MSSAGLIVRYYPTDPSPSLRASDANRRAPKLSGSRAGEPQACLTAKLLTSLPSAEDRRPTAVCDLRWPPGCRAWDESRRLAIPGHNLLVSAFIQSRGIAVPAQAIREKNTDKPCVGLWGLCADAGTRLRYPYAGRCAWEQARQLGHTPFVEITDSERNSRFGVRLDLTAFRGRRTFRCVACQWLMIS